MADEPIDDDDIDPDEEELAKPPARPGRKAKAQVPPERLLWQDRDFRRRAQRRARELGKQMADVLRRCGLGEDYVYRAAFWRDTNAIMCLAEELEMTPTELCNWPAPEPLAGGPGGPAAPSDPAIDQETHRTLAFARLYSEQALAMLYLVLAMNRPNVDPEGIARALGIDARVAAAMAAATDKSC
jgi:hypothetical protein